MGKWFREVPANQVHYGREEKQQNISLKTCWKISRAFNGFVEAGEISSFYVFSKTFSYSLLTAYISRCNI
jgi:hypothetical protein